MTRAVQLALGATAVLNVATALVALAAPGWFAGLMYGLDAPMEPLLARHHTILWLFVAAMGVGYGAAARDPARHTALVLCGGLGKLCAVLVWIEMIATGLGAWSLAGGILWDGVLGLLFLVFVGRKSWR